MAAGPSCMVPPSAENAIYSGTDTYAVGTAVTYSCNMWYSDANNGDGRLVCAEYNNTAQWLGTMPNCKLDFRTGRELLEGSCITCVHFHECYLLVVNIHVYERQ